MSEWEFYTKEMTHTNEALTFDDVQIKPEYSEIESRANCKLDAQFTRNFRLKMPLIAAPMDSVCGAAMMDALQNWGGVGCLHRFMPIDVQGGIIRNFWTSLRAFDGYESKDVPLIPIVASIGATGDYVERAIVSLESGANVLLIDVAHG